MSYPPSSSFAAALPEAGAVLEDVSADVCDVSGRSNGETTVSEDDVDAVDAVVACVGTITPEDGGDILRSVNESLDVKPLPNLNLVPSALAASSFATDVDAGDDIVVVEVAGFEVKIGAGVTGAAATGTTEGAALDAP